MTTKLIIAGVAAGVAAIVGAKLSVAILETGVKKAIIGGFNIKRKIQAK